jgi:hypothetical protein
MKQTAVEWLEKQFVKLESTIGVHGVMYEIIEQAKEMEKKQIINACNQTDFEDINGMGIHETITKGEQYYNETFKSE